MASMNVGPKRWIALAKIPTIWLALRSSGSGPSFVDIAKLTFPSFDPNS
jgi:hypothetical protein